MPKPLVLAKFQTSVSPFWKEVALPWFKNCFGQLPTLSVKSICAI